MTQEHDETVGDSKMTVSVVIPSVGRETLGESIASALRQTHAPAEVLVVFDLARVPEGLVAPSTKVRFLTTGGGKGPSSARQMGIDVSSGDLIALLDDDDYWYPEKLEAQVALARAIRSEGGLPIVACGVSVVDWEGRHLYSTPNRMITPDQPVADYLFRRRRLRTGDTALGSSMLLIDRAIFASTAFTPNLRIHEEWDWLLRATQDPNVTITSTPGTHLAYRLPPPHTRSLTSASWRSSHEWARANRDLLSAHEYADLLLSITVPMAVEAGTRGGALSVALDAFRRGRPGWQAATFAAILIATPRQGPQQLRRTARWLWERVTSDRTEPGVGRQ